MPDNIPAFLTDPMTEKLLESLVALAAEVNVLRDRVSRLESERDGTFPQDGFVAAEVFVSSIFGGMAQMPTSIDLKE